MNLELDKNKMLLDKVIKLIDKSVRITDRYTSGHGNYSGCTYTSIAENVELERCHNGRDCYMVYVNDINVGPIPKDIVYKALSLRTKVIKDNLINSL